MNYAEAFKEILELKGRIKNLEQKMFKSVDILSAKGELEKEISLKIQEFEQCYYAIKDIEVDHPEPTQTARVKISI